MDSEIICFNHCNSKICCFNLPEVCPKCQKSAVLTNIPFRIPYPFVRASNHPCSVLLKLTDGKFLDDYQNLDDLHIGVTDSRGRVTEFDVDGIETEKTDSWNQSILVCKIPVAWTDIWDEYLRKIRCENRWKRENYNEVYNNCYDFVLDFLRGLECEELKKYLGKKEDFCEKFVITNSRIASRYIAMYRKIKENGYFIEET